MDAEVPTGFGKIPSCEGSKRCDADHDTERHFGYGMDPQYESRHRDDWNECCGDRDDRNLDQPALRLTARIIPSVP